MRVFLTGATGFIGSYLVRELIEAGHEVVGLSRSDKGEEELRRAGAEVLRGDINDLDRIRAASAAADGVIHAAFNHHSSDLSQSSEDDRKVIQTLGEGLTGTNRPLIITSGTGLARSQSSRAATEADGHLRSTEFPRAATEEAADALIARGLKVMVVRLPQVHDRRRQGRITWHIRLAKEKGRVAYVGEGSNRVAAVHVSDAALLYRLVLERGQAGARYHPVAEEGIRLRDIAEVIGAGLRMLVESISADQALDYFGKMAQLAVMDLPASSAWTRDQMGWNPTGPDLLTDLREMDYTSLAS